MRDFQRYNAFPSEIDRKSLDNSLSYWVYIVQIVLVNAYGEPPRS